MLMLSAVENCAGTPAVSLRVFRLTCNAMFLCNQDPHALCDHDFAVDTVIYRVCVQQKRTPDLKQESSCISSPVWVRHTLLPCSRQ